MTTIQDSGVLRAMTEAARTTEQTFSTFDGSELFYRAWLPAARTAHKALILVHRGHEHSGRWNAFVQALRLPDVAVFAHDMRGHGRSPGERGYASALSDHVRDLDALTKHLSVRYDIPIENFVALGHSVGAVVLATWVHDYAPPIRGMVLATPAFRVKLYVPLARQGLSALQAVKSKSFIKSYVKPKMLTHDPEQATAYANDPLISRQIAVNVLLDLHDTSTRLIADAGAIRTPTLMFAAGSDWVVKNSAIRRFHDRLSSRDKSLHVLHGFSHAIFHEKDRGLPISLTREFITRVFRVTGPTRSLIHADDAGYTRKEFDALQRPRRPIFGPRTAAFAIQRLLMKTVGQASKGIRIGWEFGFDSGQSLDHVYRNTATGITPIGKLADRIYLNAIGWRGIRQRKTHLQTMLKRAIEMTHQSGRRAEIVDIASGPGRYLLETISRLAQDRINVLLRDSNEEGLGRARAIALRMQLQNVEYETADAFDYDSLAEISPRPNIAVVSGLYELFDRNEKVLRSLRGLAQAMRENGGYLIYTNQPWHPQIEMIARCLTNREGRPWIMRRRTTEEMDDLVRAAGFEKIDMLIDRWGIFTVSLARRA